MEGKEFSEERRRNGLENQQEKEVTEMEAGKRRDLTVLWEAPRRRLTSSGCLGSGGVRGMWGPGLQHAHVF